jgi:high-affinity iron transporter
MLLDIIVIVLRETLEASILIAVLLSVSLSQGIKFRWVPLALLLGGFGAFGYGSCLGLISEWFDYAGQEVCSAALQLLVYSMICFLIPLQWQSAARFKHLLVVLMTAIVCLAVIREGGELYVFYSGFLQKDGVLLRAITSGFIGLSIGCSVGAIVYFCLAIGNQAKAKKLHGLILSLVAAGMIVQSTQLLIQVDWLTAGQPLWNSNWLIAESSVLGQVVYAIFGYEATPSLLEVGAYVLAIGLLVLIAAVFQLFRNRSIQLVGGV